MRPARWKRWGCTLGWCPGAQNFKVTYPDDFALASAVLAQRGHGTTLERFGGGRVAPTWAAEPGCSTNPCERFLKQVASTQAEGEAMNFRIGEGWDVHALVPGRRLVIGGVVIEHSMGLLGHSDADVLLHAITDALLGAAGLGDIGTHFPDTDPTFRGADSSVLLIETARRVRAAGCGLAASTAPWWRKRRVWQRTFLACAPACAGTGVQPDQVNVKAKTAERLGRWWGGAGHGSACCCADLPRLTVLLTGRAARLGAQCFQCAFAASSNRSTVRSCF